MNFVLQLRFIFFILQRISVLFLIFYNKLSIFYCFVLYLFYILKRYLIDSNTELLKIFTVM